MRKFPLAIGITVNGPVRTPRPTFAKNDLSGKLEVADAEDGALGLVAETLDIPAVGENDLLDHREAQAGAGFLSGEIGFEYFGAALGRHSRAIVSNFQGCLGSAVSLGKNLNLAGTVDGLNRIEKQIEKDLAEELFVGLINDLPGLGANLRSGIGLF